MGQGRTQHENGVIGQGDSGHDPEQEKYPRLDERDQEAIDYADAPNW